MLANRTQPENQSDRTGPACPQQALLQSLPVERWGQGGLMIAVSGGSDSVALAHAAVEVARCVENAEACLNHAPCVILGHVNHHLRGAESDADERLVRELAGKWGAGFALASAGPGTAVAGQPREGLLRRLRYQALAQLAAERGARLVLTAHHADDVAETVLFRLMRGTGLRGLSGIPFSRPLAEGISLVRPLLGVRKADLLAYVTGRNLPFRHDRSNEQSEPARNWIRGQVLPLLQQRFGGAVPDRLGELAREACEVVDLLDDEARQLLERCQPDRRAGMVRIVLKPLLAARRPVIHAVLNLLWSGQGWPLGPMDRKSWNLLANLLVGPGGDARLELPGEVCVKVNQSGQAVFRGPATDEA